jgi:hypothetical protein
MGVAASTLSLRSSASAAQDRWGTSRQHRTRRALRTVSPFAVRLTVHQSVAAAGVSCGTALRCYAAAAGQAPQGGGGAGKSPVAQSHSGNPTRDVHWPGACGATVLSYGGRAAPSWPGARGPCATGTGGRRFKPTSASAVDERCSPGGATQLSTAFPYASAVAHSSPALGRKHSPMCKHHPGGAAADAGVQVAAGGRARSSVRSASFAQRDSSGRGHRTGFSPKPPAPTMGRSHPSW